MPTVLVPPRPGTWSALGCLMVDIRHDLSEMFLRPASDADAGELDEAFDTLEAKGRELLASEGVTEDGVTLERSIAMRYLGQWRSLEVAFDGDLDAAVERFHTEHEREFSYRRDDAPVELYRLQLVATGATEEVRLPGARQGRRHARAEPRRATVYFDGEATDTPVYEREDLPAGAQLRRPGRDRPARHHHAGPARRQGRGRRVAQHPDGGALMGTRSRHLRGAQELVRDRRGRDGRADPAHLPLVRDLLARLLVRAARRPRRHDHAGLAGHRRPRRHAAPEGQGRARGLRGRHQRGRRVRRQRPVPRRHALPGRLADPAGVRRRRADRARAGQRPLGRRRRQRAGLVRRRRDRPLRRGHPHPADPRRRPGHPARRRDRDDRVQLARAG